MLFIHPMWSHESQRIGKQKCTPAGYAMHGFAELIGLFGLVVLFVSPLVFINRAFHGTFRGSDLRLLAVPFRDRQRGSFPIFLETGDEEGLPIRL